MKNGVEFDFVVTESLKALELYEQIFDLVKIEVTDLPKGENEVVFSIYDTQFHMLDENPEFQLLAPALDGSHSFWFNVIVPDITNTHMKALSLGCSEVQPVLELLEFGVSNSCIKDTFGYTWMLHQVHGDVSQD